MFHVYKAGGIRTKDGKEYTIKAINEADKVAHFADGWVTSLDNVKKPTAKKTAKRVTKDDNQK